MTPFSLSSWEDTTIELFFPASAPFKRIKGECSSEAENVNVLPLVAAEENTQRAHDNGSALGKSRRVGTFLFL